MSDDRLVDDVVVVIEGFTDGAVGAGDDKVKLEAVEAKDVHGVTLIVVLIVNMTVSLTVTVLGVVSMPEQALATGSTELKLEHSSLLMAATAAVKPRAPSILAGMERPDTDMLAGTDIQRNSSDVDQMVDVM